MTRPRSTWTDADAAEMRGLVAADRAGIPLTPLGERRRQRLLGVRHRARRRAERLAQQPETAR